MQYKRNREKEFSKGTLTLKNSGDFKPILDFRALYNFVVKIQINRTYGLILPPVLESSLTLIYF